MEVRVRPWTEDDAEALEAAYVASREHLRPWMAWAAEDPMGVSARRAWIREQNEAEAAGGDRVRGAFSRARAIVGGGGLHLRAGPGALEIGYWTHAAWTRRGVATALARALCDEAFADPSIAFVEIHHDVANVASGAVPRKLGFAVLGDFDDGPQAPADSGVERRWRLTRDQYLKRI